MLEKEDIVKKWESCRFACSFSLFANDEAGHALADEGYNENYGCEHPNVVESNNYNVEEFMERNGYKTKAAVLHDLGKDKDISVINALKKSCKNCPFHQHHFTT